MITCFCIALVHFVCFLDFYFRYVGQVDRGNGRGRVGVNRRGGAGRGLDIGNILNRRLRVRP